MASMWSHDRLYMMRIDLSYQMFSQVSQKGLMFLSLSISTQSNRSSQLKNTLTSTLYNLQTGGQLEVRKVKRIAQYDLSFGSIQKAFSS